MKEVKFKRIKAEFIGFGGIKGNKYEFNCSKGYKERLDLYRLCSYLHKRRWRGRNHIPHV